MFMYVCVFYVNDTRTHTHTCFFCVYDSRELAGKINKAKPHVIVDVTGFSLFLYSRETKSENKDIVTALLQNIHDMIRFDPRLILPKLS